MKVSTVWLKDYVGYKPPLESVADKLTMGGLEVKGIHPAANKKDSLFEIEITSNRPDWLSHIGVAREIAAVENLPLKLPEIETHDTHQLSGWKVNLKDPEGCPYYSGVVIEGIEMAETPDFIRERLEACGVRLINVIVDITNYVLLETGQPLHAFDADLLKGKEIQARRAKPGEKFTAIDGKVLALTPQDVVIADANVPVALAGIMGGKDSEVNERTRNIFLESAYFNPRFVRQSARAHKISSESSYRFERRVDPAGVDYARQRALLLIKRYAKPRFVSTILKMGTLPKMTGTKVHLAAQDLTRILGMEIKSHAVTAIFARLGFEVKSTLQSWEVTVPSFRSDILTPVDLVEEFARIYGYDQIPSTLPVRAPLTFEENPLPSFEHCTREVLAASGLYESVTFSLISNRGFPEEELKNAVVVENPQHKELRWLRPSMLTSLLTVIRRNYDHSALGAAFFEIANTYQLSGPKKVKEERHLALALSGVFKEKNWRDPECEAGFYDLKGILQVYFERLGIGGVSFAPRPWPFFAAETSEEIMAGGKTLGRLGKAAPFLIREWGLEKGVYFAEISLEKILECRTHAVASFKPLPRFPAIRRDLAVVVAESVHAGEVIEEIRSHGEGLIVDVGVFDIFRGGRIPAGSKNMAFRVTYQSDQKTLVSEDIQELHAQIASNVAQKFQATFQ
ncbi:MAG TPA: phenylalanine--tRNA ligase subunit beta [Verrucomicrobiae bacterium]|jgi:phenylalanyl-tRNA synthetase beta chain|nr:phenylalanine--tRNA ligase subunit beta [Verrucomicrobiae bacterium]